MALVNDTGPLVAMLNRRDPDDEACQSLIRSAREPLVIPAPVLPEVDYLVRTRAQPAAMLTFLDDIARGVFKIEPLLLEDYRRIRGLCAQYADSDIGLVDAAVLAVVERLNEPKLATLDHRHFGMMRPRHMSALRLLPE